MFEADGDKCGREAADAATEDASLGRASASGRTKGEGKFLEAFENENFLASSWRAPSFADKSFSPSSSRKKSDRLSVFLNILQLSLFAVAAVI